MSTVNGVPTTNATRTLIDLGSVVPSAALETALERALLARMTTFDRLLRRFFELASKGRPGIAALRSLLVERDPTLAPAESDLETLLFKILREAGLPAPIRQHPVMIAGQSFRLDAAYPELMIFMEGDGFGVHSQRDPFERDRSRQNLLVVAGWAPLRFTWQLTCAAPPQRNGASPRGANLFVGVCSQRFCPPERWTKALGTNRPPEHKLEAPARLAEAVAH